MKQVNVKSLGADQVDNSATAFEDVALEIGHPQRKKTLRLRKIFSLLHFEIVAPVCFRQLMNFVESVPVFLFLIRSSDVLDQLFDICGQNRFRLRIDLCGQRRIQQMLLEVLQVMKRLILFVQRKKMARLP